MEDREQQEDSQQEQPGRKRRPMELFGEVVNKAPGDFTPRGPSDNTRGQEIQQEITPTVRISDRERLAAQEDAPDLSEGWERARDAEWLYNLASQNRRFAPNPDFEMTQEKLLDLTEGLPEDSFDYVSGAGSQEEAEFRAQHYRKDQENEERLGQMGMSGTALRIGAAMTDPVVWGASAGLSALTGPLGLVGTAANRLTRVQRIVRGGTAAAAGNVAIEGAINANKPIYDDMNLLYAAGLGFGIGGGLSALSRNPSTRAEAEALRRGGDSLRRAAEDETTRITREAVSGGGDAGAARISRVEPLGPEHTDPDDFIALADRDPTVAPRTAFGTAGGLISSVSRLKSSNNPASRAIGNVFAEDAVGNADRSIASVVPASQKQLRLQRTNEIKWGQGWKTNLRQFMEEKGDSPGWKIWDKPKNEREFSAMVSDYVEGVRTNVPTPVKAQGDILRNIFEDYRVNLNQPGAYRGEYHRAPSGFGTKEADPNYIPHEFDYEGFNSLVREVGSANVEDLFARSIRNATDDITEEAARKAARSYVKTIRNLRVGIGGDAGRILGSGDAEEIKRLLRDQSEMSANEVEDVVDALTARKTSKGSGSKHGKSRTPLDMSTEMNLRLNPENGPQGSRQVSIREFFNRDAHDLFTKYNRRMSGELAMSRTRVPGLFDGLTNNAEWETLKLRMREVGERKGQTPKEIEEDIAQADYLWRAVKGIPDQANMGRGGQFLRKVRDWNFMRVMGQVGFAQIPELGVATTGMGLKAASKSVPGFRTMWRNTQTGKIDDELVDELEMATGFGGDWLRSQHVNRFDNLQNSMDVNMGSKFEQGYENFTREGKRAVFAGSGMASVNTFVQRFALTGVANRFDQMARGGKRLSTQRLRAMGLTDAKVESVLDNIRRHAVHKDGLASKKLQKLNLKDWDATTAADFEEAMFSYTRRLVQENDPGQFRPFMSNPIAQTILQFRSFIMGAHTKALLHNIHMRDFQAFSTFTVSSMLGGLGYMAYTYSNAQGRSNKQEYLQERLTWDKLAKASFERSSWAALIPTAIDTAAMPFTDPIFDFRTTGQSTDILFGNPSSDLLDSVSEGVGAIANPIIEGRAPAQSEIQSGLRMMPFQNLHGITQMTNLLLGESGLPERPPND